MTYPWGNSRRFNSWADRCRQKYGSRLQRVSIHAGFSCPNRDGTLGYGGCTFCNNEGFSPSYCQPGASIAWQIDRGVEFLSKRYKNPEKYLAYFQAYTNTHGSLQRLKSLYGEALSHPAIWGLAIGTRPDCVDQEKLDYFSELAEMYFVILEYGIESCFNDTLERVNRGHTFEDSVRAVEMTASRGLHTGGHLIFGLPGESREQMLSQAETLSALPLNTLKFHQLQIVRNTPMATEYEKYPEHFSLFSLDEYVEFMVLFLERLRPDISIERLSGEVPPAFQVSPGWGKVRADQIIRMIEARLAEKDTWQGRHWKH